MRLEHAADAPVPHGTTFRPHFYAQPTRAVALTVIGKRFAHGYLPSRRGRRLSTAARPGVIRGRGQAQHEAELAHRQVGNPLGDGLVSAHRVGWPSLRLQQATADTRPKRRYRFIEAQRERVSGSVALCLLAPRKLLS